MITALENSQPGKELERGMLSHIDWWEENDLVIQLLTKK